MRRAPLVVTGTVAGLAGVLVFHTTPAHLSLGAASGTASGAGATSPAPAGSGSASQPSRSGAASSRPASSPGARAGSSKTRTVTGPAVNYNYGVLSVSVTVSGRKITKVGIASLDDGGQPQSQFIDQQSIPVLEQEAMQAQNANIQSVSGASYTSAGFQQSLQAALQSLGIQ
jgi:uncharacterized protein with FMN-binding domain